MKRVVLVTCHYLNCPTKAGFPYIAESYWNAGWHVLCLTESISWLTLLRGQDSRCEFPIWRERNRLIYTRERLASYIWLTPFHPVNLRSGLLNRLGAPVLKQYPRFSLGEAEEEIARADLFVFDSDHGLFLFDRFKEANPRARYVYRVSDDIRMMRHHPLLPAQEERIVGQFDLISTASTIFNRRFPNLPNVYFHNHGLDKTLFDRPHDNPYKTPGPNVVYVGMHYFDAEFTMRAVRIFPDWNFHVFGEVGALPAAPNLTCYGLRPFAELVPYLQHADIGLQCLTYMPGAEWFTDSLKMFQYTYCKLPIVAPGFLKQDRPHVFYYEPGDDASIRTALLAARVYDRKQISTADVLTWDDLAAKLAA